jgi:sulfoxide reductase heme-binding subunit YedZ
VVHPRIVKRAARVAIFLACLIPLGLAVAGLLGGRLGPDPIRASELRTGQAALILLIVTLAVTPLRRLTGWNWLGGYRRMLGLFAFFYVCLHFLVWFGVDQFFALKYIGKDIVKRPYITVGFASFLLMIPLAITSSRRWVKADLGEPTTYGLIVVALLLLRFVPREVFGLLRPVSHAAREPRPVSPSA